MAKTREAALSVAIVCGRDAHTKAPKQSRLQWELRTVRRRGKYWVVEGDGTRLREEVGVPVDKAVGRLVERIIRHEEQQPVLGYVFKYLSVCTKSNIGGVDINFSGRC